MLGERARRDHPCVSQCILNYSNSTNTVIFTLFLLFKAYVGAGILSMPFAFENGTFIIRFSFRVRACVVMHPSVFSNIGVMFVASLSLYCIHLLMVVHQSLPPRVTQLEEIGAFALGGPETKWGRIMNILIKVIVAYTQLGFSIAYGAFAVHQLWPKKDVVVVIFIAQNMCVFSGVAWRWWIMIMAPLFIALSMIKKLKILGPFAVFGFAAIFISCLVIVVYSLSEKKDQIAANLNSDFLLKFDYERIPVYFGIIVFAYEGIGVIVPVRSEQFQMSSIVEQFPLVR
jgi:proton-coupled amino acid transporter